MRLFNFFFKSITFSNIKEDMAFWQTFESCHIFFGNIPLILQIKNSKKIKIIKYLLTKNLFQKKKYLFHKSNIFFRQKKIIGAYLVNLIKL